MDYRCIFFDLDHTLWDYEINAAEALYELHHQYALENLGAGPSTMLLNTFKKVNDQLWSQYDLGHIQGDVIRHQRFHLIFKELGVDDYNLSLKFSNDYIRLAPTKNKLIPYAAEVLGHLSEKYHLAIITNGFEAIQAKKIKSAGIDKYFKTIITSERAGCKKPSRGIFNFALEQNGFTSYDAIMIGDNLLTDIAGGNNALIDTVYFNPKKIEHNTPVTYEIHKLIDLTGFL